MPKTNLSGYFLYIYKEKTQLIEQKKKPGLFFSITVLVRSFCYEHTCSSTQTNSQKKKKMEKKKEQKRRKRRRKRCKTRPNEYILKDESNVDGKSM